MFDSTLSQERYVGTRYTATAALLAVAVIFIPAVSILSRPLGSASILIAVLSSVVCAGLARLSWKNFSEVTIPSILTR